MANPFAQGGWDPFGELPATSTPHTPELSSKTADHLANIRPARAAPPPPKPTENPFGQLTSTSAASDDPFAFLSALHTPGQDSSGTAEPAPPSYFEAADLPPPPAYDAATALPPPPSYNEAVVPAAAATIAPARTAPLAPAGARGPLHAGMPSRPAPPAPARPAPAAPVPARAAPPPPQPARSAPSPPAAAAAATSSTADGRDWIAAASARVEQQQQQIEVQQQLQDLQLSGAKGSSSTVSSSYASTGNVGAVPRGAASSAQQALQQELNAQIRLPPLNPKTAAPLKTLAAGLGSLFAGPAGDAGQILQWAPRESGSTLPSGAKAHPYEDHDSAECAELTPQKAPAYGDFGPAAVGSGASKPGKVSCMAVVEGPGWLLCGTTEGSIQCWSLGQSGGVAKLLHSWGAHSGKVKGIAVSPSGRLFTGSGNGAVKMWGYGNPAYSDPGAPPRLLRQLKKIDARTGVALNPHSKVIAVEVSTGGRILWSVGKNTINLWSVHNGEHLGTLADMADELADFQDGYASRGYAAVGNLNDVNPRTGLDVGRLNSLFEHPAAELFADAEAAMEGEKDVKAMAVSAAVKSVGKASKALNKFANKLASRLMEDGRQAGGESDSPHAAYGGTTGASSAFGATPAGTAAAAMDKTDRWGAIKHLVAAGDGSMWLSYKKGLLEKYSEGGQLLWSSKRTAGGFKPAGITALAVVGSSLWVGDQGGMVWVLDAASGTLHRSWKGHVFPVRSIAAGGHLVYTLGKAGSIRAWPAVQQPQELTTAWQEDLQRCLQEQHLKVLSGTWNVNETKPSRAGLQVWLGQRAQKAHIVMIGLQEVEMGTGSVALDVVYQSLAKSKLEAGTQAAQAWATAVGEVLSTAGNFKRIGLRQMSGVLVLVYARAELEQHIGEVATASVACGVMGYGGNKGAVAISFSLFRRRVVIVSSHFAAHQEKVEARNADYVKIVRHLHFHNVPTDKPQQQQQYEASDVVVTGNNYSSSTSSSASPSKGQQQQQQAGIQGFLARQQGDTASPGVAVGPGRSSALPAAAASPAAAGEAADDDWGAGVRDAELLVWVGDFNYRVDCPAGFVADRTDPEKNPVSDQLHRFVHEQISAQKHLDLLSGDQCSREMAHGRIFHGLAEGPITFMPTYKFEKGRESNRMQPFYDQGEKKRVPAWTDRIFFRGSGPQRSALEGNAADHQADVRVWLSQAQDYNSLMEINDSDHKPVFALLNLQLPWYQQQQQRSSSLERLWQVANSSSGSSSSSCQDISAGGSVSLLVEPQHLLLQGTFTPCGLLLSNPCSSGNCMFVVQGSGPGGALPLWLEVSPSAGVLPAGGTLQLRVQGSKAHWNALGGSCELRVLACLEGSVDSSKWPLASYGYAQSISVTLP